MQIVFNFLDINAVRMAEGTISDHCSFLSVFHIFAGVVTVDSAPIPSIPDCNTSELDRPTELHNINNLKRFWTCQRILLVI